MNNNKIAIRHIVVINDFSETREVKFPRNVLKINKTQN